MNLGQMRTQLRQRMGLPTSDGYFTDTVLNGYINEALAAVSQENRWPWLRATTTFNTVAGTANYSPPTDWTYVDGIGFLGEYGLSYLHQEDIDRHVSDGIPTAWTMDGDIISLRPTPNSVGALTIHYYKMEPELTADGNTPLLPRAFHYAVIAYAAYLGHMANHAQDRANAELQNYNTWVSRMQPAKRRASGPMAPRVRPGNEY